MLNIRKGVILVLRSFDGTLKKTNIILNILCAIIILLIAEGVIYARYMYSMSESGSVGMGIMLTDVIDISVALEDIKPGNVKEAEFRISNTKDGIVSDLRQIYTIKLTTTGNLPLSYEIYCKNSSQGIGTENAPAVLMPGQQTEQQGMLPGTEEATHIYTLKITWDDSEGQDNFQYSGIIDYASIEVYSEQVSDS